MSTVLIEIRFKPLIHPLYPILYLRAGSILEIFFQTGGVCIRASHITRLHLFVLANSLFARGTLYAVYKVHQLYRTGMSDILNPKGNFCLVRLTSDDAYHCLNNVIDVGEIAAHLSMIEHADGLSLRN